MSKVAGTESKEYNLRDGGGGRSVSPVRAVNDAQLHGLQGQDGLDAGDRQVIAGEDGEVGISFLMQHVLSPADKFSRLSTKSNPYYS